MTAPSEARAGSPGALSGSTAPRAVMAQSAGDPAAVAESFGPAGRSPEPSAAPAAAVAESGGPAGRSPEPSAAPSDPSASGAAGGPGAAADPPGLPPPGAEAGGAAEAG